MNFKLTGFNCFQVNVGGEDSMLFVRRPRGPGASSLSPRKIKKRRD